jgi:hypothetical protein
MIAGALLAQGASLFSSFWLPLYHIVSFFFSVSAVLRFQGGTRSRLGFTSFYIVSFKETRPPVKPGGPLLYFANEIYVIDSAPGHFLLLFLISGTCRGLSLYNAQSYNNIFRYICKPVFLKEVSKV